MYFELLTNKILTSINCKNIIPKFGFNNLPLSMIRINERDLSQTKLVNRNFV